MIEITLNDGSKRSVVIAKFAALDGWDIQEDYVRFLSSEDRAFRRQFTLEVLSYATVVLDSGQELPLSTNALIDNHLGSFQNVEAVFNGVLIENGIDPKAEAQRSSYWEKAGAELAIAFVAQASALIGPALNMVEANRKAE